MSSLFSPARPGLGRFSPTLAKYAPSNNKLSTADYSCCTRDIARTLICPLITLSCLGSSRLLQFVSHGFVFRQFEQGEEVWALFSDRWLWSLLVFTKPWKKRLIFNFSWIYPRKKLCFSKDTGILVQAKKALRCLTILKLYNHYGFYHLRYIMHEYSFSAWPLHLSLQHHISY